MKVVDQLKECKKLPPEKAAKAIMEIIQANFTLPVLPKGAQWEDKQKRTYVENGNTLDLPKVYSALNKAFTSLGEGAFSSAYILKKGWVIKANDQCWVDSPTDSWFDWAKVMIKNQDNPFMTKIASLERKNGFFIAIVERLKHDESSNPGAHPLETLYVDRLEKKKDFDLQKSLDRICSPGLTAMCDLNKDATLALAKCIMQTKRVLGGRYDLHGDNTMVRKDGYPVVNDPFPDTPNSSLRRPGTYSWSRPVA